MARFFRMDINQWVDVDTFSGFWLEHDGKEFLINYSIHGIEARDNLIFSSREKREGFIEALMDGSCVKQFEDSARFKKLEKMSDY